MSPASSASTPTAVRRRDIFGRPIAGTGFSLRPREVQDPIYNEGFRRRLEVWGRARSGDRSVKVAFGESGSYTDMEGNITIDRTVPPDGEPGHKYLASWGLMSHELCHHRWTARDVWMTFRAKMEKKMKAGNNAAQSAARDLAAVPGFAEANALHAQGREADYNQAMMLVALDQCRAQLAANPGDPQLLSAEAQMQAAIRQLATHAADCYARRDALIAPHASEHHTARAAMAKAQRMTGKAGQEKDCFNIIEDGRIETHLRIHEPSEYRSISLLNQVHPRVPDTHTIPELMLVPCPSGYVPVDADGNDLPTMIAGDGTTMVVVAPGTKLPVWTDRPLDPKRQMRAALLADAVPEFDAVSRDLHPDVRACLDECRPLIDAGVRGNTQECMDAAHAVQKVVARHGMWPDPEDAPINSGPGQQGGQQGDQGDQQGDGQQGGGQQGGQQGDQGDQQGGGQQGGGQSGGAGGSQAGDGDRPGGNASGGHSQSGQGAGQEVNGGYASGFDENTNDTRADAGGAGDQTSDSAGGAEEGADGGGISADEREKAEKDKRGSASSQEAAEEAKKAEKAGEGDRSRAERAERNRQQRGSQDGRDWSASDNNRVIPVEKVRPAGPAPSRAHVSQYGRQLAAVIERIRMQTEAPERRLESGRLDRRRLTQAASGDNRVFWKEGRNLDTDIVVDAIYDVSGSMGGHRKELLDSALAVDSAMRALKLPHAAYGYDGGFRDASHYELRDYDGERDAFGALAGEGACGGGGTPTAHAVQFGTARLALRKENKRIMLVFTDGQPNDVEGARQAIENARAQGITIMGCYYSGGGYSESEGMKSLFGEDFVALQSISDLPKELGKKLLSIIHKGARRG